MKPEFDLKAHVRHVPDFPKPGILFYDISTLLIHPEAWRETVDRLRAAIEPYKPHKLVGIESSTLVRQLDALEARGLIERVVDRDRRARLVKMTPAAVPVIERIKQLADELGREILAGVDTDTVVECAGVLKVMRERLRERAKADAPAEELVAEKKRVRA